MKELEDALKPESRSCMGDKYETSRAMLHLEFEKLAGQVEQFNSLRRTVTLIAANPQLENIGFGSVVKTTAANYFIAIPAGEMMAGGEKYFAVGINSPIAQQLLGKGVQDSFNLNEKTFTITDVIN